MIKNVTSRYVVQNLGNGATAYFKISSDRVVRIIHNDLEFGISVFKNSDRNYLLKGKQVNDFKVDKQSFQNVFNHLINHITKDETYGFDKNYKRRATCDTPNVQSLLDSLKTKWSDKKGCEVPINNKGLFG